MTALIVLELLIETMTFLAVCSTLEGGLMIIVKVIMATLFQYHECTTVNQILKTGVGKCNAVQSIMSSPCCGDSYFYFFLDYWDSLMFQ